MFHAAQIVVVGGGTAGLACAWALSRAGHTVTVLERYQHVHEHGSHGGATRVIRHAYHEGEHYLPLIQRADQAWVELERGEPGRLLRRVGLLEMGDEHDSEFLAARRGLERLGAPFELLDTRQIRASYGFRPPSSWIGALSPNDGYLVVEACLDALRDAAAEAGATFRYGTRVREVDPDAARVLLESGEILQPDVVVVAAGAFVQDLLIWLRSADGRNLVRPERKTLHWRMPRRDGEFAHFDPERLPVWAAFAPSGFFYGFPASDVGPPGLKIACHRAHDQTVERDPTVWTDHPATKAHPPRAPDASDAAPIDAFVHNYFPLAGGEASFASTCKYASTASGDFIIDRLPGRGPVWIVGGLSGHGFKFAPVLGELIRDLIAGKDVPEVQAFALRHHNGWPPRVTATRAGRGKGRA